MALTWNIAKVSQPRPVQSMSAGHLEILSQLRGRASNRADGQAAMMQEATLVMGVSAHLIVLYAEECPQWSSAVLRLLVKFERRMSILAHNMYTLREQERSDLWVEQWVFDHMGR
ncbi:uncharacterized protein N7500_010082 [Penicillium coprophilum]|uniref:uncharacterized protein n=1 Tax=Penicillium coprophilum TaxID=36646 RepID=UPI0023985994|nr:uncharacterized protein N7500_010082 [Penicillium coprophilum]KAJ5154643.1 hypothetical protein N7500_010082 [Penicillium coprophilum]